MYAIAFDLKIHILKKEYGKPYNKTYDEIRQELETLGFKWTQGSLYISTNEKDTLASVYKAINKVLLYSSISSLFNFNCLLNLLFYSNKSLFCLSKLSFLSSNIFLLPLAVTPFKIPISHLKILFIYLLKLLWKLCNAFIVINSLADTFSIFLFLSKTIGIKQKWICGVVSSLCT